jgi:hypothetical protein
MKFIVALTVTFCNATVMLPAAIDLVIIAFAATNVNRYVINL